MQNMLSMKILTFVIKFCGFFLFIFTEEFIKFIYIQKHTFHICVLNSILYTDISLNYNYFLFYIILIKDS